MRRVPHLAAIHAHFYQPPREDPWTGEVPEEPSAAPYHDWNERVARECYIPNAHARLGAPQDGGKESEYVNNYARLSFDFGPTLLTWLERAQPAAYQKILDADRTNIKTFGHGNAVAHPYHHLILPLCSRRDRRTELRWGLADFKTRFGREPEGFWLPEAAVDDASLIDVAQAGLSFAILSESQAQDVQPLGSGRKDLPAASPALNGPCLWNEGDSRLSLFFYHDELSSQAAFGPLTSDAARWSEAIEKALSQTPGNSAPLLVAMDGETFGHHKKFAEMGLAWLLARELPRRGVARANLAFYLRHHRPRFSAAVKPGPDGLGTSWSCAHGIRRWLQGCSCSGPEEGQKWKKPLREALEWLQAKLDSVYEREAVLLFKDPWEARDALGPVLPASLQRGNISADLLARHLLEKHRAGRALRNPRESAAVSRALDLVEMETHTLAMFTSCGWFFQELARLEPLHNLRSAARAVDLARRLSGRDWEGEFRARLKSVPCGEEGFKDGEELYKARVLAKAGG